MPVQLLTGGSLVGIQVLEITFHIVHLSVKSYLQYSFPILLGSANTMQISLIKLPCKWGTTEKIIKLPHTVVILNEFNHLQNKIWSLIFFWAFLFTQAQVRSTWFSCFFGTVIAKVEAHLICLLLCIFPCLIDLWILLYTVQWFENRHLKQQSYWNPGSNVWWGIWICNLCHFCHLLCFPKNWGFGQCLQILI